MVLNVDDYLGRVLAGISALPPIELPLADIDGCVLAEDVIAPWPLPSFDNSAMDGYAVLAADIASASENTPVTLRVIDDIPAGFRSLETVVPGTAIRIMTGAPMPAGADTVVPVELTDGGETEVTINAPENVGACIRKAGEDVFSGQLVLSAGVVLSPRSIALLAAVGKGRVHVIPKPRIAVMSTGTELVEPGTQLEHGLISDSNSFMLVAAANRAGAQAFRVPPVADDEETLRAALRDQLHRADLIVTSGGVSMGAYDPVKALFLGDEDSQLHQSDGHPLVHYSAEFHKVAMQPGMPQGFGTVSEGADSHVPIIMLPGNPVSSYVSFHVFVLPAIRALRGLDPLINRTKTVELSTDIKSSPHKRQFARGRFITDTVIEPVGTGQGSHVMGGLADSDVLFIIPEGVDHVAAGSRVDIMDQRGDLDG